MWLRAALTSLALLVSTSARAATPSRSVDVVVKARALDRWGDRPGALRLLAAYTESAPSELAATEAYGTMLLEDGSFDLARRPLERVLQIDPKDSTVRSALIRIALHQRENDAALALANEGVRQAPGATALLLDRARVYLVLGDLDAARADVRDVLRGAPEHVAARDLRDRVRAAQALLQLLTRALERANAGPMKDTLPSLLVAIPAAVALASLRGIPSDDTGKTAAPTSLVDNARAIYRAGDWQTARRLLEWHLEATPDDVEALTTFGTLLSWEGANDESRRELARALALHPGHYDALRAAINNELWSSHPERAEALATQGLQTDPASTDLRLARARARFAQGNSDGAREDVDRVLTRGPNSAARALRERIDAAGRVWTVGASYALDVFSDGRTPWHEATLQVKRSTPLGSLILRDYEAWRFDSVDNQLELEAFPRIYKGTYLDIAGGFSPTSALYPSYRVQADIYQTLPWGLEGSIGYRHLEFRSGVDIGVVTMGRYVSNWYFLLRSFITPGVAGTSVSGSGLVRRYFQGGAAYLGLRYGYGISKEELRSANDVALLGSHTFGWESSLLLSERLELGLRGSVSEEALVNRADLFQYDLTASVGARF